jgi:hypothetical protein
VTEAVGVEVVAMRIVASEVTELLDERTIFVHHHLVRVVQPILCMYSRSIIIILADYISGFYIVPKCGPELKYWRFPLNLHSHTT